MGLKHFKKIATSFLFILSTVLSCSQNQTSDENFYQNFLEFVKNNEKEVKLYNDFVNDYKVLEDFARDMKLAESQGVVVIHKWLLTYAYDQIIALFEGTGQMYKDKFMQEIRLKNRICNAIDRGDSAFLKKHEEDCVKRFAGSVHDPRLRSFKLYKNMVLLGNLYGDYENIYDALRKENIISDPAHFLLFLDFINKDLITLSSLYVDNAEKIKSFCDNIKESFPPHIDGTLVAIQEEKKQQKAKIEQFEQEQKQKRLAIQQKKRKDLRRAQDLAKNSDQTHLKNRFCGWMALGQDSLQQKRYHLAQQFFSFVRAIELKIQSRKELFDQQVFLPNSEHARFVNTARERRGKIFNEVNILTVSEQKEHVSETKTLNDGIALARAAKTARRLKQVPVRNVIKNKSGRYAPDLITCIQENNLSANHSHEIQAMVAQSIAHEHAQPLSFRRPLAIEQDFMQQPTIELKSEKRCHNPYSLVEIWSKVK